ncbi:hypothetical protein [Micromonospora radicis]|uniref:DNA repair protein n=1 Tax=Micromonospora radicis TaxID=1894971 RepID=A0A418MZQ7_9ACTN|nr:hypothetical protein [Micromonospora radicis]RIV40593.1 hypothetical protein D2L64_02900 [Micromonospora radicis]
MPIQPHDRYQQDTAGLWPGGKAPARFPGQPPHHGRRTGPLSWDELNRLPAGTCTRHPNTR